MFFWVEVVVGGGANYPHISPTRIPIVLILVYNIVYNFDFVELGSKLLKPYLHLMPFIL